jgi:glycosyltransferase involved in cell wall biosynthesis
LRNQSCDSYEIIVVDNASTDGTAEIARNYADKVVYEARKGVAFARQRGFEEAKGNIIASTDADTIVDKDWLYEIERSFSEDIICTYGPVYLLDGARAEKVLAKYGFTLFLRASHLVGVPNLTGMNFAVMKRAFYQAGGFDLKAKSAEDVTLALRLKKIGKIGFNPRMLVYTSARRLKAGWWSFLKHHALNYLSVVFFGKTREFEDIR